MALSFRRDADLRPPEALVFADGFPELDALAEDLDAEFGPDQWVEVARGDAEEALNRGGPQTFAVIAIGADVPQAIAGTAQLIRKARASGMLVLLVVGDISSRSMHQLLHEGVSEFTPYPEPTGALREAIDRLRVIRASGGASVGPLVGQPTRKGRVITVYGVAGGVGASTYAVNLAWELAQIVKRDGRRVALLDFNFQYGSVATFLDVPRREAVYELVNEASNLDQTGLTQALSTYQDRLHVLTAPRDALPLDIVSPSDVKAIVTLSREAFDYVVIDLPQALMNWSEPVYNASDEFHAIMEIDMRSAQNMFRFLRTLKAEDMPTDKLSFYLNRAPGLTDLSGKTRVKRVADSLGIAFTGLLPKGGDQVINACDQGIPLAEAARSNPLRKEIARIAQRVAAADEQEKTASG